MPKKVTTEDFICRAKKVHGDLYNYSLVNYVNANTKVNIICNRCGNVFEQLPANHLKGCGCSIEGGNSRGNTATFTQAAKKRHSDRYDYSQVQYRNAQTKVKIICNTCGHVFMQRPNGHLNGQGCPIDGRKKLAEMFKKSKEEFVKLAKIRHGDHYDYSKVKYKNAHTKVIIICNPCGKNFKQTPHSHLQGRGCPIEGAQKVATALRSNTKEFIKKAQSVHGCDAYNYDAVEYTGNKTKVIIVCNLCSVSFKQTPDSHLQGRGCPHCIQSRRESFIKNWLLQHNLIFKQQYRISACRSKKPLPFDFAVFFDNSLMYLIEYQGEQHYKSMEYFGGEKAFKLQQRRDQIKRNYCQTHNIPLLTLPYWLTDDEIIQQLTTFVHQCDASTKEPEPQKTDEKSYALCASE